MSKTLAQHDTAGKHPVCCDAAAGAQGEAGPGIPSQGTGRCSEGNDISNAAESLAQARANGQAAAATHAKQAIDDANGRASAQADQRQQLQQQLQQVVGGANARATAEADQRQQLQEQLQQVRVMQCPLLLLYLAQLSMLAHLFVLPPC